MSMPRLSRLPSLLLGLAFALGAARATSAAALDEIATANASGHAVFLVVTDAAAQSLEEARQTARQAQALVPASAVVELNRSEPAQAEAVKRYRLTAAPLPLVLVVASNGVAAGAARPGEGAAQRLASLVPSPRKAEMLKAFDQQQTALVVFSRTSMPERSALMEALSGALKALEGKGAAVLVDLDDAAERAFLAERKVEATATRPVVLVLNAKGQALGRLEGAPTVEKLVATARSKAPCCPGGNCK